MDEIPAIDVLAEDSRVLLAGRFVLLQPLVTLQRPVPRIELGPVVPDQWHLNLGCLKSHGHCQGDYCGDQDLPGFTWSVVTWLVDIRSAEGEPLGEDGVRPDFGHHEKCDRCKDGPVPDTQERLHHPEQRYEPDHLRPTRKGECKQRDVTHCEDDRRPGEWIR